MGHRSLSFSLALMLSNAILCPWHAAAQAASPADQAAADGTGTLVYVGTYTGQDSQGIYGFRLGQADQSSATLEPVGLVAEVANPSFLALDQERRLLFTVSEISDPDGRRSGGVSALTIERSGKLKLINQRSSKGAGPCHLALDKTGRFVLVANYGSGSVAVLPVGEDGTLAEATDFKQHSGHSVNTQRQAGPHAHFVTLDPANRFALVCDLGLDQVLIYKFDAERGKLMPNDPPFTSLKAGAGPRHLAFHPDGEFVYVINELDSTISAFAWDGEVGRMREIGTASTLPPGFSGDNTTAEIDMHPSGKFLYGSNRGRDSIAMFSIDQKTGELTYLGEQSTGGKTPRNFELSPDGKLLLAANQDSGTLQMCHVADDGRLTPAGELIDCPMPVCVKFFDPRGAGP
jgi:6-phosphogluconolactonase